MHRLLVTGAGGFLGRNCLAALAADEWEVVALDWRRPPMHEELEWHEIDLLEADEARRLIARVRPSHLLHLAWTGARPVYSSPENHEWVEASAALFEAFAAAGGRRVVGIGSSAEYDWSFGTCREDETPLSRANAYSAAKVELAGRFEEICRRRQISGAWARPFFLFGPYEHPQRFVPSVITALLRAEPAQCTHGRQVRDYLYAVDAAEALVSLLSSDFIGVVNVASGEPLALAELAGMLASKLDGEALLELGAVEAAQDEAPRVVADVQRLRQEVGWHQQRTLDQGLDETIDWWREELESRAVSERK